MIVRLAWDLLQWCGLLLRPRNSLEAENLFLRRRLALYRERGVKPRRVDAATRVTLTLPSRWFDWRSSLVVVRPETLIRWRECLDWLIPLSEAHLRKMLKSWVGHYNHGRPHMALGPGVPDPPPNLAAGLSKSRHRLDDVASVCSKAILGGLHHVYLPARA